MKRMLYCGLSGVGKDYLLDKARPEITKNNIEIVSFGQKLFEEVSRTFGISSRDELLYLTEAEKRSALQKCLAEIALLSSAIVNTHIVVANRDGFSADISGAEVLRPTFLTCVVADPEIILSRTTHDPTRHRRIYSATEIDLAQKLQEESVKHLSKRVGIECKFIDNSEADSFNTVKSFRGIIEEHFNNKEEA